MSQKPLVVVVGPPAAGKTRAAKRVARTLGVDVIDTDAEVVARWGPIPEIFAAHGEQFFRDKEREAVMSALLGAGVVALGGGAIMHPATRSELGEHRVALIEISAEAVAPRLDNDKRPLLRGGLDAWKALVETRQSVYDEVASQTFDASHRSIDDVARDIADWVREDAGL